MSLARVLLVAVVAQLACARALPPVELDTSPSEAKLARGRYLAGAVMACGSCHSQRDWTRFAGPPRQGSEFAGSGDLARGERFPDKFSFAAPNLTPTHLGSWSDGELGRAIALGQSKDGRGLFPYMPYFEYREALARDDLSALVAFLRTLEPSAWTAFRPRFPMPGFVLNGFPEARTLREKAPSPGAPDHGRYLTEIAGCQGCHTQADRRGTPIGTPYAGGREFRVPAPGRGVVRSANLTPDDETGLGRWTKSQFIARFRDSSLEAVRNVPVSDGGMNSLMPWWAWSRMSEEDLGAIYDYLRSLPAERNVVVKHTP